MEYSAKLTAAEQMADEYRRLIHKRTGLRPAELQCPREQSSMTPCIARDGSLAVADAYLCVGCDHLVANLLVMEQAKALGTNGTFR